MSILNVAKTAADSVLGLKSYKRFQAFTTKTFRSIYATETDMKEVKFNLESITHTFGTSAGKGAKANDALKMVRGAQEHLKQADEALRAASDSMREIDWEK
jgi:hypothetical protein